MRVDSWIINLPLRFPCQNISFSNVIKHKGVMQGLKTWDVRYTWTWDVGRKAKRKPIDNSDVKLKNGLSSSTLNVEHRTLNICSAVDIY
jgi:hypothetical protein